MSHDALFDLEPGHTPANPQVRRVKNPAGNDDAYAAVMRSAAVLDVVERLIGPNIRWQGSKLNMKSAGVGSPVAWHQDWAFYPHTNDDLLAVGVPVDDMTTENGCLLVLPGSHKGPIFDHHDDGVFVGVVAPDLIDHATCLPLEAKAGSITLHHVRLLHGSASNTSGQQRRLFLVEYNAADAWPLASESWSPLRVLYCVGRSRNRRVWSRYRYAFPFRQLPATRFTRSKPPRRTELSTSSKQVERPATTALSFIRRGKAIRSVNLSRRTAVMALGSS